MRTFDLPPRPSYVGFLIIFFVAMAGVIIHYGVGWSTAFWGATIACAVGGQFLLFRYRRWYIGVLGGVVSGLAGVLLHRAIASTFWNGSPVIGGVIFVCVFGVIPGIVIPFLGKHARA